MELGSWGWEHEEWVGPFYPEDLPVDWRLDYYANEFPIVVIPGTSVTALEVSTLRFWDEELPAAFGFLVEASVGPEEGRSAVSLGSLVEALAVIRKRLRGFLWPAGGSRPEQLAAFRSAGAPELAPVHLMGEPHGPGWEAVALGLGQAWTPGASWARDIDGPAVLDAGLPLAALRAAVEDYLDRSRADVPRLILTGQPPDPIRLRETRSMLELMGL
jgi:hypothetical protein